MIKQSYEDVSEPAGLMSVLVSARADARPGRSEQLPVLVTGICGRLGRRLARALHRERKVIGIDRRPFEGRPKDVEHYLIDIRKKKTEYISDAAQRQKIGQIEDAQQTAEYQDVLQQEADLTAGHGVLRATGFVAVSASDPDELERAVAAIEQAAIQASCETRRLWGQQAQGFAVAALPLARGV